MTEDVPLYITVALAVALVIAIGIIIYLIKKQNNNSEDEIISLVNESTQKGELAAREATMIHNIFEYDDKDAKDIMVHRKDIVAIDGNQSFKEAINLFKENQFSRFPVYIEDLDNIIGIIHMRELFEYSLDNINYAKKIKDIDGIMKKPGMVPETHSINTLFTTMQTEKTHLFIVKDEYGQTSGLVSMEDIIEEVFGNIFDEYDKVEEPIIDRGNGLYIMFGKTELEEVAKCLQIGFDEDEIETLNGFITKEIGHIPKEDEKIFIEYKGFSFKVLDVKENMINAIKVQRIVADNV